MRVRPLHSWAITAAQAVALQRTLAAQVEVDQPLPRCELIAGADVSYDRFSDVIFAGVVVLRLPDCSVIERRGAVVETHFPYVPGLLSFREAPALLEAFAKVRAEPDVIVLDGQGIAHPRRIGIASHLGLWLDRPCLGCAKSLLTGSFTPPEPTAGSTSPLMHKGERVGEVVRTRDGVAPVFVSPGHRIDCESAVRVVLESRKGYRLPEPTRQAHLYANELRREGAHRLAS
jgi:deoxyribonuclease V